MKRRQKSWKCKQSGHPLCHQFEFSFIYLITSIWSHENCEDVEKKKAKKKETNKQRKKGGREGGKEERRIQKVEKSEDHPSLPQSSKATFTRQTNVGQLVLTNSNWYV